MSNTRNLRKRSITCCSGTINEALKHIADMLESASRLTEKSKCGRTYTMTLNEKPGDYIFEGLTGRHSYAHLGILDGLK